LEPGKEENRIFDICSLKTNFENNKQKEKEK